MIDFIKEDIGVSLWREKPSGRGEQDMVDITQSWCCQVREPTQQHVTHTCESTYNTLKKNWTAIKSKF